MTYKIKIKDIKKEDVPYIKNLCEENNCELSLEWKSKYNNYVMYDYEPYNSKEFEINACIKEYENFSNAKFVEYLYNKRVEKINKLNLIFNNEVQKKICEI